MTETKKTVEMYLHHVTNTIKKYIRSISWKRIILAIFLAIVIFLLLEVIIITIVRNNKIIDDFLTERYCYKTVIGIRDDDIPEILTDCFGAGITWMWLSYLTLIILTGIISAVLTQKKRIVHGLIGSFGIIILTIVLIIISHGISIYKKSIYNIYKKYKQKESAVGNDTIIKKEISPILINDESLSNQQKESRRSTIEQLLHEALSDGRSAIPSDVRLLNVDVIDHNRVQQLVLNFSKELVINNKGIEVGNALYQIQTTIENNRVPDPRVLFYKFLVEGEEINKSQWFKP